MLVVAERVEIQPMGRGTTQAWGVCEAGGLRGMMGREKAYLVWVSG